MTPCSVHVYRLTQVHNVTDGQDWGEDQEEELAPTARHYDHYDHELDEPVDPVEESDEVVDEDQKFKMEQDLKWRSPNGDETFRELKPLISNSEL